MVVSDKNEQRSRWSWKSASIVMIPFLLSVCSLNASSSLFQGVDTLESSPYQDTASSEGNLSSHDGLVKENATIIQNNDTVSIEPNHTSRYQYRGYWNASLAPIGLAGCCGLGHRLSRTIPTLAYALRNQRVARVVWMDAPWNSLFSDTAYIQTATNADRPKEFYANNVPLNWDGLGRNRPLPALKGPPSNVYRTYKYAHRVLFTKEETGAVVQYMVDNVSELVLKKLRPVRAQVQNLHLCAHFRLGNNETGNWQRKTWRHVIDPATMMNMTLNAMLAFVERQGKGGQGNRSASGISAGTTGQSETATTKRNISVFVTGDDSNIQSWFRQHAPDDWHVVEQPVSADDLPESGVWFGEASSTTNHQLSQEQRNERMAEALADSILLGECSALYVPTFSTFTILPIIMTHQNGKEVYFRRHTMFHSMADMTSGEMKTGSRA